MSSTTNISTASAAPSPTVDPILTAATLVQLGICLPGLMVNGFLVFVIFRNRKLRTTCCFILILLLAICDCLAEFSLITVPTFLYLSGITIPLLTCFFIEVYGPYAHQNTLMLMLLIGVDRLISIVYPLTYKNLSMDHKWKYIAILLALPSIVNVFITYNYYLYSIAESARQVFCFPTDFFGTVGLRYANLMNLVCNIGTFLVYATIWLLFKLKVVNVLQNSVEQHILRSLYILMLLTFFCWIPFPLLGNFVFPYISPDFQTQLIMTRALGQLNKLAQALNGVVLYISSSEYRSAMQKEWRWIFSKIGIRCSNQVSDNNNNQNFNRNNNDNNNINNNAAAIINVVNTQNMSNSRMLLHQRLCASFNCTSN